MQLPEFKRDITNTISIRLRENRHFMQVIIGPRQVGKTVAIQQVLNEKDAPPYHYAVADLPAPPPLQWIAQQWDLARLKLQNADKVILVLDEIQKIKDWPVEVKRLWDVDTRLGSNIQTVLLGSSSLLIQKGLSESLAGRFELIKVSHWSWKECRDCFGWTLDKFIYFGGYPAAAVLINDEKRWSQYIKDSLIETAISKDILLLNPVEKPALLRQLFVLSCEYGGQILSYQKMLGQLTDVGNTTTLAHYQRLLESAFLISGLGKYSSVALRKRNSSPKWLPLNTALMTALPDRSFNQWRLNHELWGRLTEVAIGAYLVNKSLKEDFSVYYWRQGNYEVDFVLVKGKKIVAIEVKSGRQRACHSGVKAFLKRYSTAKAIIVGSGGIDIDKFLEMPVSNFLP